MLDRVEYGVSMRDGVGATARIMQRNRLRLSNIVIEQPVIILVARGTKLLKATGVDITIETGQAVALSEGGTFDVINRAEDDGAYLARWIAFDPALVAEHAERRPFADAQPLLHIQRPPGGFFEALESAADAVADKENLPSGIARHRMQELLVWLETLGMRFTSQTSASFGRNVRKRLVSDPGRNWESAALCREFAVSEATFRRRLAAENLSFQQLLTDVRMSTALSLLQSTNLPILHIAQAVGYESQSRFAARFRARFGFPPSAIRGHHREPVAA